MTYIDSVIVAVVRKMISVLPGVISTSFWAIVITAVIVAPVGYMLDKVPMFVVVPVSLLWGAFVVGCVMEHLARQLKKEYKEAKRKAIK